MKRLFTLSLSVLCLAGSLQMSAQTVKGTPKVNEVCASALIHKELMISDPNYRAAVIANEARIQQFIQDHKAGKFGPNSVQATVYTIPVVVHVIHLGESVGVGTNISDAQINSAISNLNTAYRNQSPYNGVDIEVQFALAQRDPNCNATTGINRVNGAGTSDYSTNGITRSGTNNETTIKALSKWPNSNYYNIWVVAGIDGNMGGGGIQGYAYFPGAGSSVDGAVMLYNAFGYDPTGSLGYNLKSYTNHNGTAIHELGHAFNLYHTFEGDDANNDGTADQCPVGNGCGSGVGDCCADVPPHQRSASNCNTSGTNSCDGGSSNSLFVHNFMDYSSDACKDRFSSDQATRMRAAIYSSRGSLINSLATSAPSGSSPATACSVTTTTINGNYPLGVYRFTFNDLDVGSGSSYEDAANGYVDRTCYFQTTVTAGTAYTATINTGTSYNHNTKIYIDYNNDGDFVDAGETVFSTSNLMTTHTGTITIPASPPVTGQPLRMRVMADYYTYTIGSCTNPTYGQAEDYAITITAAPGSPPTAAFTGSPTSVCVGSSVAFTDQSTNSPTSWAWTFQGGSPATSTSQNPTVTYTASGVYSVTLTATNSNGSNSLTKTSYITVNAKPTVTANATSNPICSGSSTTLSGGGATTYTWTGGVTNGVAFSPSSTSTYTVTGTDGNGCTNTAAITVTVNATPTVSVSGTMTITSGGSTTLTASGGTTYSWTPSTGLNATTGSVVTANPSSTTVYTVTGTTSGCSGTKVFTVTVNSSSTTSLQSTYCGTTLSAFNQVIYCNAVSGAQNYNWELKDMSNNTYSYYTRGSGSTDFEMDWATGATYGKTYQVKINTMVGGVWQGYGAGCLVTTPAVPTTNLAAGSCGITETSLSQTLWINSIVGATNYNYELRDNGTGTYYYYTRQNNLTNFQMDWVSSVGYGKTYTVKVNTMVGGVWMGYGSGCNVTTPGAVSSPSLQPSSCGITETSLSQTLWCTSVTGASDYRYEVTDQSNGNVTVYTRGNNLTNLQLDWLTTTTYARTYSIRVAAYLGTTWGSYGSACLVTTPAAPTTQLQPSSCNITETTTSQTLYCNAVNGADNYRYQLTDQSNGNVLTYTRGNWLTDFQMSLVTGIQYSRAYSVKVAASVGGTWLSYGSACMVTTAATIMTNPGDMTETETGGAIGRTMSAENGIMLNVYPNPNDGHVYLRVNKEMKVVVTNVLGESVYEGKVKEGTSELYFLDAKPGMYIIRVTDGENATQVRMIKQ